MRTWVRGPDSGPDRPDSVRTGSGLLGFEKVGSGPGPDLDLPGSGLFEKMRTFAIPGRECAETKCNEKFCKFYCIILIFFYFKKNLYVELSIPISDFNREFAVPLVRLSEPLAVRRLLSH